MTDTATRTEAASVSQRVLHLMEHYRGGAGGLNNPVMYLEPGRCDPAAFGRAVRELAARHEALRTTFTGRGQRLTQLIHDELALEVTVMDAAAAPDPPTATRQAVRAALSTSLDLAVAPARFLVVQRATDYLVCGVIHHLATDGWSNNLLVRDLRALYRGAGAELPPVGWQYRDFASWQRDRLTGPTGERHREYWQRTLAGGHGLALGYRADTGATGTGHVRFGIDAATTGRLRELAAAAHTTLFAVLLSVFQARVYAESAQRDISVATLFANRRRETANTVGCLSTLAILRTRLPELATFRDVLASTRATLLSALPHQEYPLQLLPSTLLATDSGRADDVVFQMLPAAGGTEDPLGDQAEVLVPEDGRAPRFDLEVILAPDGDGLAGSVRYAAGRVDPHWIAAFCDGFRRSAIGACDQTDVVLAGPS